MKKAPTLTLMVKLGSIAVHTEEYMESEKALRFANTEANANAVVVDRETLLGLLADEEIKTWIAEMGVMLPRKRKGPGHDDTKPKRKRYQS